MSPAKASPLSRRNFLELAALSMGALGMGSSASAASGARSISIVTDPADPAASSGPVGWAVEELSQALAQHGIPLQRLNSLQQAPRSGLCIVACGRTAPVASVALQPAALSLPDAPECLVLAPAKYENRPILLACGSDGRGLMYALLELADRVQHAGDPYHAIQVQEPLAEQPFNQTRSIGRSFVSDVEDKPWFNDRAMWPAYFSMLAAQRFNRFTLNFGIGHDFLQHVIDSYFLFAYPFLLSVPGYNVRAVNLPDRECEQNLETLQIISRQAVAHGIDFQLGIWTHGYQWQDSPNPNYTIEGLTPENHAAYSREALAGLLEACPASPRPSAAQLRGLPSRRAREIWAAFAQAAKAVYVSDITYGPHPYQRGHWLDRLPAIDADIAAMAKRLESMPKASEATPEIQAAVQSPPPQFVPGEPLQLVLSIEPASPSTSVRLYYRQVNQSEPYQVADAAPRGGDYRAEIPAGHAQSSYPLQYYF
jgi:hypothetical protein